MAYRVVAKPSVHIATPVNGQTFAEGQSVLESFTCTEG